MNINIPVKGNRTIATVGLYIAYKIAVNYGVIPPMPAMEMAMQGAIVVFFKMGIENALKENKIPVVPPEVKVEGK